MDIVIAIGRGLDEQYAGRLEVGVVLREVVPAYGNMHDTTKYPVW